MQGTVNVQLDLVTFQCGKLGVEEIQPELLKAIKMMVRYLHQRRVHSWTGAPTQQIRLDDLNPRTTAAIRRNLPNLAQSVRARLMEEKPHPPKSLILLLFK